MRNVTWLGTVLIIGLLAAGLVLAQSTATGPVVNSTAVTKKAGSAPPASAKPTTTAGGHKLKVSTANNPADTDSFWIEKLDIDGDGDVEDSNLVWDDEDKVLYAYSAGVFACKNGGTATAELLVATYAAGNTNRKPAGSGFWVAYLDKGECGAQISSMWGCKVDATGTETKCGAATLDEKNDDLVIVTAS
jgi:hypothetical protein